MILPYNRAVKDLNGLSKEEFIDRVKVNFDVSEEGKSPYMPKEKATYGMF